MYRLLIPLLSLLLIACSGPRLASHPLPPALTALEQERQRALALQLQQQRLDRLNRLLLPISRAAVDLCPPRRLHPTLGLGFGNRHSFKEPFRTTALRELGVGQALQVLQVTAGGPAAEAGIRPGDVLVALAASPFQVGPGAAADAAARFEALLPDKPVVLSVARGGQVLHLTVTPVTSCRYELVLVPDDEVNAYADHRRILITRGMLRFAADDNELALVLAHEMAHNLLGHLPSTVKNTLSGGLLDLVAIGYGIPSPGAFAWGAYRLHARDFEAEADYLGLYLMARAGLPLDRAAHFWRRVASDTPAFIDDGGGTHPSVAERFISLEATLAEIRDKQARNLPLTPRIGRKQSGQ